jgi:cytochrome b
MQSEIKVWDPFVRLFHWSLVATFAVAYVTGDDESRLHVWSGYAILALVAARIVWGVVGTRHARFRDFVYPPRIILGYARSLLLLSARRYLGHNPLGGAMVVALLIMLALTGWSGYLLLPADGSERAALPAGQMMQLAPIAPAFANGKHRTRADKWLMETHEALAEFTLFLVALHIAGVLVSSLVHRENLVRAMITGRKRAPPDGPSA